MAQPHHDHVALITGGTGALGQAVVRHFLSAGARVHVSWIVEEEVERLKAFLQDDFSDVRLHQADVTSEPSVTALFKAIEETEGRLDVLANIVGGFAWAALEETDLALWQRMMAMNATSAFLCTRAAAPLMAKNRHGRIINVSALPAVSRGAAKMSAYAASKAAVLNFTQSASAELIGSGITVNAIIPTIIDTPANRKAMPKADTATWLAPDQIAGVIGFLASDTARIVTGAAITLSNG